MSNWIATNELRFVERNREASVVGRPIPMVRILQQKWVQGDVMLLSNPPKPVEEWRDVPVVEEE